MFITFLCARFQADPRESHLIAVKCIFRYLKGTPNLRIWCPKDTGFNIISYTYLDFVGCKIEKKRTSKRCQFLGPRLVSWYRKKENSVSVSVGALEAIHCFFS